MLLQKKIGQSIVRYREFNNKQLSDAINLPWCIMGDFNEMLCSSDKVGDVPLTISRTRRLNDFLAHTRSINANVQGGVFTWKKLLRGQVVYEKLDRVLFKEDCAQLFSHYLVINGYFTCSNHAFVLLNTEPAHPPQRGTNFKY